MPAFARSLLLGLTVLVAGCATSAAYPRVPVDEVVVFEREADIQAEFEVISEITPRRRLSYETLTDKDLLADARKQAARLGANALLVLDRDEALSPERAQYMARTDRGYESSVYIALRLLPASDPPN